MYITELHYTNVGPISDLHLNFRRNADNVPVPVVFVGKNGSGKSILLSNIVDALYLTADKCYSNASARDSAGGTQYYKIIAQREIQNGKSFLVAHISFEQDSHEFSYVFKSGEIAFEEFRRKFLPQIDLRLNWNDEGNYKAITAEKNTAQDVFWKNIACYFGPDRYTRPFWLGRDYTPSDSFSMSGRYDGKMDNPIVAENSAEKTVQWLFDIIVDSRLDNNDNDLRKYMSSSGQDIPPDIIYAGTSLATRKNAEQIMSAILGEKVIFRMNSRAYREKRFTICRPDGNILVSSLDALSTGQLALFQMFATIIRYADANNPVLSVSLEDICGLVIIDEIELHLHSSLQREVLPRLIRLFPKIQFVITSHSPLFLLGMNEFIGEEKYDIYDMPGGVKISAEQFSEFESAYSYFKATEHFRREITEAIDRAENRPLIITEGATDWKHMKAAYEALKNDPRCSDWLPGLDFEFLEYEPENSKAPGAIKLEMGHSQLESLCEYYSILPGKNKKIFIADRDVQAATKKLTENGEGYKSWGNSVFSLCLPIPKHRTDTPDICIEHYYTDEEIKRPVKCGDGIERRLFMGNEFNGRGFSVAGKNFYCECKGKCGTGKISIIDGSGNSKVSEPWTENSEINYALPKKVFAEKILHKEEPFADINFSAFIELFKLIRDILRG